MELSTERQIGMGVGPIPRSAVLAYAKEWNVVGDRLAMFMQVMRGLDNTYLELSNSHGKKDFQGVNMVAADDADAVRGVFGRLEARQNKGRKQLTRKH